MVSVAQKWGQLIISVIALVVGAIAFVRANDLAALREADSRNADSIREMQARVDAVNKQLSDIHTETIKNTTLLQLLERRSRE